jgi:tetratricopeptide (TPR) repeat protein
MTAGLARPRSPIALVLAAGVALVLLVSLVIARPAHADDPATKAARKHFTKGEKLFQLGKFDDALVEYEAAYDQKPLPGFLYNIGQCHRNLGNYKQAVFSYRSYLRQVPDAANREAVLALIDELDAKQRELEADAERERLERERLAREQGPTPSQPERGRPIYKRGWFWGGVAAVAVIAVGAVVLTRGDGAPSTDLGNVVFD